MVLHELQAEPGRLVMPAPVAVEVDYLVRRRGGRDAARRFLSDLANERFSVECLTPDEYVVARELDWRYADLDLGLADLSVSVLAHRYQTRRILTFDYRHFRVITSLSGEAFTLLPEDR